MKKVLSMVLAVVMLASVLSLCFVSTFTASAEEVKVVVSGQKWQWLVWSDVIFSDGTATIPQGALTGEDTGLEWGEGNAPFGESRTTNMGISLDYGNKFASLLRTTFTLADVESATVLKLFIKYDENPTVYLNGTEIWALNQYGKYNDASFVEIDLSEHVDKLVNGENIFCVAWEETSGGSILDAELITDATLVLEDIDSNGFIVPTGVSSKNVAFGDVNSIIDWNADTCHGDGYAEVDEEYTISFRDVYTIGEIFIRCKNEPLGDAVLNEDGSYGYYDIYAVKDGISNKIATNVPALPPVGGNNTTDVNDSYVVKFDNGCYEAEAIVIKITSWNGPGWKCLADVGVKPADEGATLATHACNGEPLITGVETGGFYHDGGTVNCIFDNSIHTATATPDKATDSAKVSITFNATTLIDKIYIQSKNEGLDQLEEGDRVVGYVNVFVIRNGAWSKIAENVPASPDGYTLELDKAYKADAIGFKVASWKTDNWVTLAELHPFAAEEGKAVATTDVYGNPLFDSLTLNHYYGGSLAEVTDGHNSSCAATPQGDMNIGYVALHYVGASVINKIYLESKDEGMDGLEDRIAGTYDVFVVYGGALYRVATGVPATPDGYTLELDKAYKADGVAFMPTSWNNGNWTTLSEVRTYSAAVDAEIADVDIDGKDFVIISKDGGADYGNANAPGNLIDGKENTCFGSNWPNIKSISVSFLGDKWFDSVKLTAMNEGADQLEEGEPFGKVNVYVVNDGVETLVAEGVELWTVETAESVTFKATKGDAIKVVFTEWNTDKWAAIAEMDYTTTEAPVDTVVGDLNDDGAVSIADVAAVLDMIAGKADKLTAADVNEDGSISIADVAMILDIIAGK